jgi:hypothetical protein
MVAPLPDVLKTQAIITYMPGVDTSPGRSVQVKANYAYILSSGWVRVTWLDGSTTLVSPAVVREIAGKGVEYA